MRLATGVKNPPKAGGFVAQGSSVSPDELFDLIISRHKSHCCYGASPSPQRGRMLAL